MGEKSLASKNKVLRPFWQCYLNVGQDDELEVSGYKSNSLKQVVTWIGILLTLGFLRLVFFWRPDWMLKCTHSPCHLAEADKVLIEDQYGQLSVEDIHVVDKEHNRLKQIPETPPLLGDAKGSLRQQFSVDMAEIKIFETFMRYFNHKNVKYVWMYDRGLFLKLSGPENQTCSYFHDTKGLSSLEQARRRYLFGPNAIYVEVSSICKLLITQGLNPFYCFQVFSVVLWYSDQYYWYASTIVIISVISLTVQIREVRQNQKTLKEKIQNADKVTVYRETGERELVSTEMLVPGDVIEIPRQGCLMHCDAVLVTGTCVVNESMLTGESMPVIKTPLPNPQGSNNDLAFNVREHSRHILFCGTQVVQTRHFSKESVRAVVVRTGFMTAKGELIRVIMFPKPMPFQFTQESMKWIGFLALLALCGMTYTLVRMVQDGEEASWVIRRTLDLVTIVIPPALPAAMTVGIVYAQGRLKKENIYCINSSLINVSAVVNVICFDKTGTLTEDGLDLFAILPVQNNSFENPSSDLAAINNNELLTDALASCHSLTLIDGQITGDPLDAILFKTTGWELEEPEEESADYGLFVPTIVRSQQKAVPSNKNAGELGIIKVFPFSSNLQRMSVFVRDLSKQEFTVFAKGSPEMIVSLSKPDTVPKDFHDKLVEYTQHGYRVLALAWRPVNIETSKISQIQREELERDLIFLGLLIMENKLKAQSTATINELKAADMRIVMVTGDNMLTALSVARECHIIEDESKVIVAHVTQSDNSGHKPVIRWVYVDEQDQSVQNFGFDEKNAAVVDIDKSGSYQFAVTGRSWALLRTYYPEVLNKIAIRGAVFARMLPEQKQQLIELLQSLGYYVGMCGDGANDCGALKTAHTGISVSQADASVASPFTTKENNISCVPTVIREGRAALVTSFGMFKYMALYSMTQFTTVCILYWISANITDFQFLYEDLFLITSLFLTFGYTKAYPILDKERPTTSLVAMTPIVSMILQIIVALLVQVVVLQMTVNSSWYHEWIPNEENENDYTTSYQVTTLFMVSIFQYITGAVIFSKSAPYRKSMFSNYYFLINVIICYVGSIYVVTYPADWIVEVMDLYMPPSILFRWLIVLIALANFFLAFILESYVMDSSLMKRIQQYISEDVTKSTKTEYMRLEDEVRQSTKWPPSSDSDLDLAELLRQDNALLEKAAVVKAEESDEPGSYENSAFMGDNNESKGVVMIGLTKGQQKSTNNGLTEVSIQ